MVRKIIFLMLVFFCSFNAYALVEEKVNPAWEEYIKLSDVDKEKYLAIPEPYTYDYEEKPVYKKGPILKNYAEAISLPSKFTLADYNGKIYSNAVSKNQSSLGLCWAFSSLGTLESNMLLNGVSGIDTEIQKCNNDITSDSCKYKLDYEKNEKYKNHEVDTNVTFSERNIDYVLSRPYDTPIYSSSEYMTLVSEKYNPYAINDRAVGSGGNFTHVGDLYTYGITPVKMENEWAEYTTEHVTKTLYQIYDINSVDYVVTDYYIYPAKPVNDSQVLSWQNGLKELIYQNGAAYISTVGPQVSSAGACYYYNSSSSSYLVHYDGNCGKSSLGWHAMQIIGWDDNYSYKYCKVNGSADGGFTQSTCESNGYEWVSGTGAWILKNSWGSSKTYLYLSYDSIIDNVAGVRGAKVADFDNRYNEKVSYYEKNVNENVKVYKFYKNDDEEKLSQINIKYNGYNANSKVSISNDGVNYTEIGNHFVELPGMRSYTLDNYNLSNNNFYIKVETLIAIDVPAVLTKNVNTDVKIDTYLDKYYYYKDTNIDFKTITSNIKSGTLLEYKVFNEKDVDVTNKFVIDKNYVVLNDTTGRVSFDETLESGKYVLKTYYDGATHETEFEVLDYDFIKIKTSDKLFVEDNEVKFEYNVLIDNYESVRLISSNEDIVRINKGVLLIQKSGYVTITVVVSTEYGDISKSIDIIIYDDVIESTDDFLAIFNTENQYKSYLIVNDLDFKGVTLSSNRNFRGVLDGDFHVIKNVNQNVSGNAGLFTHLYDAFIRNIVITNSNFASTSGSAGALTYYASNTKFKNISVSAKIASEAYAGGIAGYAINNTSCEKCTFNGSIIIDTSNANALGAGIFGIMATDTLVKDSYNKGSVSVSSSYSSSDNMIVFASGIGNMSNFSNTKIVNSYNVGTVKAAGRYNYISAGLSHIINGEIKDSYYLESNSINLNYDDQRRSQSELLNMKNFHAWNFKDTWYIDDNYPVLRVFPVQTENVDIELFTSIFNKNTEYVYKYNIEPYGNEDDIIIENLTPDLIDVTDSKIITKDKLGIAKIKVILNDVEVEKEFEIKEILSFDYDKGYTNKDVEIDFNLNCYQEKIDDNYILFSYMMNEESKYLKINNYTSEFSLTATKNEDIKYRLLMCDEENCNTITEGNINIDNIDKDIPNLSYSFDKKSSSLLLNLIDEGLGLDNPEYLYGISDSFENIPDKFDAFENNVAIENKNISYINKYLWVKNVSDLALNSLCDNTYCVYDLNVLRESYVVNFYGSDKKTLLKKESYLEDEKVIIYDASFEDDNYVYKFISWEGYVDDMIVTKDIDLYAIFEKTSKKVASSTYTVEDNIIKNIRLNDIYGKYYYQDFVNMLAFTEGFELYHNNQKVDNKAYLKTGMEYRNKYKIYKIIVTGDVNGDGAVKMNDLMKMANHLIDESTLFDEYLYASDINEDNKLKMNDLTKLANIMISGGAV